MSKVYHYLTKKQSAFSLAELVIAIFLLVVALLAIVGVFFAGASAIKKGAVLSHASDLAYNEKIYLELYDFDRLCTGMTSDVICPPGSSPFFMTDYPKTMGSFVVECEQAVYSHPPSTEFYLLYVKLRVSDVPAVKAANLNRSEYIEVKLDLIVPRNKN